MRESPDWWSELRYSPAVGADGLAFDTNAELRARVAEGLRLDRRPGDLPLLRFLAVEEALSLRKAPLGGA